MKYWHTYFWEDRIGKNLGDQILEFLEKQNSIYKIKFTKNMGKVDEGFIHYKKRDTILEITLLPRVLLNCVAAILNISELSKKIFNAEERKLKEYIEDIKKYLLEVFIQTIEEKTGDDFKSCSINPKMNTKRIYISGIIGMILYLFQAAGFIDIVKAEDYMESNKVKITRKMVSYHDGTKHFFYEKYESCIDYAIDTQII